MNFGEKIRQLRVESGKTLKEVSDVLEITVSNLCDIERNRRRPFSSEKITAFLKFLNKEALRNELQFLAFKTKETFEIKQSQHSKFNEVAFALARKSNEIISDEDDVVWEEILKLLEGKKRD